VSYRVTGDFSGAQVISCAGDFLCDFAPLQVFSRRCFLRGAGGFSRVISPNVANPLVAGVATLVITCGKTCGKPVENLWKTAETRANTGDEAPITFPHIPNTPA